ncbi:hypothetical protein SAMN05421690_10771 [Nitrosomonas sp. Nm51]|uniref:hypothetical protein n=1 Tax=Nitrosomonas sp. Nm51 TaxID=133720 RepID=UPI0008D6FB48|nr:hypothetical protein [Nitrosomonas sp. Nm51]SER78589.1 hypothetical protein SAMN05421690_10771 [Nitrosomonas sp. Nm51]
MPKLIKVCGASRSGTTMLDLMLGNSTDVFSCGEVVAWFRPWRHHHFKLECQCGQSPCSVWKQIAYVQANDFHENVFSKLNVNFVVDSSKDLCWVLDSQEWATSKGIDTYNILIWKNPVNLAYSHWKRGKGLDHWQQEFISYHDRFFKSNLPFRAVNYNELVEDSQKMLSVICNCLEMPYFEGKERFWENQHCHYLFGSGVTAKQVSEKSSKIWHKDNFPPEFKKHIHALEKEVGQNARIQQILSVLKKNNIKYNLDYSEQDKKFTPQKPYPLWYYGKKTKQMFKRYFPESYSGAI